MSRKKPWWKSKTLWANAIAGALVALEGATGRLQPLLPVNFYAAMATLLPMVNAMLRVITTQAVCLRAPSPAPPGAPRDYGEDA